MRTLLFVLGSLFLTQTVIGQFQFEWNLYADLELSRSGDSSHFYLNEIHRQSTDWIFDIGRIETMAKFNWSNRWIINAHLTMLRKRFHREGLGRELDLYIFKFLRLNLQWLSKDQKTHFMVGRFLSPFGGFYKEQLNWQRDQLMTPLAYSYYTNISDQLGFTPSLWEDQRLFGNGEPLLGMPLLYNFGYRYGFKMHNQIGSKWKWDLAIVNGSAGLDSLALDPFSLAVISRINYQPTYFAQLGLSIHHGNFITRSNFSESLDNIRSLTQTVIGLHYQLEFTHFELKGEFIASNFRTPLYLDGNYLSSSNEIELDNLAAFSFFGELKYEPPWWSGGYFSYRYDVLSFGNYTNAQNEQLPWDNDTKRHSLSIGYKLSESIKLKLSLSTQRTDNQNWDGQLNTFRLVGSYHL